MADAAAAASTECSAEGLQLVNEAQCEEHHSDCEDASSSPPSQTGPSSFAASLFLKKVRKIRQVVECFLFMGIVSGQICSKSPVPSASLSVLDALLSEDEPAFLEVAIDSTGFSTAKTTTICSCITKIIAMRNFII